MNRKAMSDMLSGRHKENRDRIKAFVKCENVDGTPISRGHASTALSNARKEQLLVELVLELVTFLDRHDVPLSERAETGFRKLVEPQERHYNRDGSKRWQ